MKLSVVVPCYNEENNIHPFYELLKTTLAPLWDDTQVIFINDGSSDSTLDKLREVYTGDNVHVRVISFSRNFGKEAAILAGLKSSDSDYVSIIDADLQQHPKYILEMIEFLDANSEYDSVAAVQDERIESKILSGFKSVFYRMINKMSDIDIVRSASDFRTCRRNVVEAILSLPEKCRFSKGIFAWVGFNTHYIPYDVEERGSGSSKWSFWKLFAYAIDGIVAFSTTPLVISSVVGVLLCLISFIFMIIIIAKTVIWGDPVAGFPTLAVIILFSSGIQLLFLGILGQYLAKSYTESKQRPAYIIKEYLGGDKESGDLK